MSFGFKGLMNAVMQFKGWSVSAKLNKVRFELYAKQRLHVTIHNKLNSPDILSLLVPLWLKRMDRRTNKTSSTCGHFMLLVQRKNKIIFHGNIMSQRHGNLPAMP
jgi:hypothetical protein